MKRNMLSLSLALLISLALGACAKRTPTVTIPDGAPRQELVSASQNIRNFDVLDIPFVLPSQPRHSTHVDFKFVLESRGYPSDVYEPSLMFLNGTQVQELDLSILPYSDEVREFIVRLPQSLLRTGENTLTLSMGG